MIRRICPAVTLIAASLFLAVAPAPTRTPFLDTPIASAAEGFVGITPVRLLDTREGNGAPRAAVGQGGVIDLQVTGRGGIPASGVTAVVLNVTVTGPTASGFVTAWPTGEPRPNASNVNFVPGQTVPNLVIVKVGAGGRVSLFNSTGATHLIADASGYYGTDSQLVPTTPTRLLDTRNSTGGISGPTTGTVSVQVTGRAGVPVGATSVVLNVTVTEPSSSGYLTVWPNGVNMPNASNLNYTTGQTVPNLVIVKIGTEGKVNYFANVSRTHVIMDVLGYTSAPTPMTELLDFADRSGGSFSSDGWSETTVQVQGQSRLHSLLNNGVCNSTNATWVEYNLGRQWGTLSSTISFDDNFATSVSRTRFRVLGDGAVLLDRTLSFGQAENVTVNVTGVLRVRFEMFNANPNNTPCSEDPVFASVQLTANAGASFPAPTDYNSLVPSRILDTRSGVGAGRNRVVAGGLIDLQVAGRGGVPTSGVSAIVMNLTVTDADASGFLTSFPSGQPRPNASNVNYLSGQTVPNLVVVPIGTNGRVSVFASGGPVNIIGDVLGWYAGSVDARAATTQLVESFNWVHDSGGSFSSDGWSESTVQTQGQSRLFSLRNSGVCRSSSATWVEYNLGRQWRAFTTTLSFDDNLSTSTSRVRFRIVGDGVVLTDRTLAFGQSENITANVAGVLRLRIELQNANPNNTPCSEDAVLATPVLSR